MQLWIVFLLVAFALGAHAAGRGRRERPLLVLLGCLVVTALFTLERFG